MEKIQLTLVGRQQGEDGETLVTKSVVTADYEEKNGGRYILYEEAQEDGGPVAKNLIKLKGGVLELTKRGAVNTHMVFASGRESRASYATPYGCLQMEIATRSLDSAFRDGKMEIRVDYDLASQGRLLSRCLLTMEARLRQAEPPSAPPS